MDENTASVPFREQLRRNTTRGNKPAPDRRPRDGASDENTPLLPNGDDISPSQDERRSERSAGYEFFFNPRDTPGRHSNNRLVSGPAMVWHVTKVTLLSSKLPSSSRLRSR